MSGPSRELFRAGGNAIGTWRCRPFEPEFPRGWIDRPHLVFPRTSVLITQEGHDPIATDPNVIVIYRGKGEYARQALDPAGDICEWFELDPAWIRDALGRDAPDELWADTGRNHAIASPPVYLMQRWLTRFVATEPDPDPLLVEEALLRLVHIAFGRSGQGPDHERSPRRESLHRDIVTAARAYLGTNFTRPLTIAEIGHDVGASPYHLARIFRRHTGWSIHQYLTNLRLRAALGWLEDSSGTIADIAVDLGFADNSHLTKTFREKFGITPSQFRDSSPGQLSTILIA